MYYSNLQNPEKMIAATPITANDSIIDSITRKIAADGGILDRLLSMA